MYAERIAEGRVGGPVFEGPLFRADAPKESLSRKAAALFRNLGTARLEEVTRIASQGAAQPGQRVKRRVLAGTLKAVEGRAADP
jgi:hypothetical protein